MNDDQERALFYTEQQNLNEQFDSLYREFREAEDPPDRLFHYTTADGLIGITRQHILRASNAYFLNDVSEPRHAQTIIQRVIDEQKRTCSSGSLTEHLLESFWSWAMWMLDPLNALIPTALGLPVSNTQAPDLYVFCLSAEPDLLSQWRAYSEHGSGYALGFSSKGLEDLVQRSLGQYLVRVVYQEEAQLEEAKRVLGKVVRLIHEFERRVPHADTDQQTWIAEKLFNGLLNEVIRLQAKFKSPAYQEEKEWRIMEFVHPRTTHPQIQFRSARGRLVPYLELEFGERQPPPAPKPPPLPIEQVIAGPTLERELSKKTLHLLLSKHGYSDVAVDNSGVPFRL